jgi:hypothetical protein
MSENKPEPPNPLRDAVKGLGLLLRAAKTTVEKLPKKDIEEMIVTSAREVGRAIENVASTVEREVLGRRGETKRGTRPDEKPKGSDEDEPKRGE